MSDNRSILVMRADGSEVDLLGDIGSVSLEEVGQGLSCLCRFGGRLPRGLFYSVAEHSVRVMEEVRRRRGESESLASVRLQLLALFHDAGEWLIGDVPRPMKSRMRIGDRTPDELEAEIVGAVLRSVPLVPTETEWRMVLEADDAVLMAEGLVFWPEVPRERWGKAGTGADIEVQCWNPEESRQRFNSEARALRNRLEKAVKEAAWAAYGGEALVSAA